jgi:serine/threonine protein kinase
MIGTKILNYEIKSLLGEGGMGNVYLGEHAQLGRKVAIKMLHPRLTSNSALRERFKNEASAMAHLQHPNIVALYDYMENEDGLFLIMEYVEGHELDHYIKNVTGPIGEEEIEKIMAQTLGAFEYAHSKGIVHRDIKPSNILLTAEGQVKVLDFGIAKLLDADKTLTKTGTQMGTVLYMSPEQVKGEKVDQRSDIYALGVTLFQMATGQAPYRSDTTEFEVYNQIVRDPLPKASTIYPGASEKIHTIIAKATAKDLKSRYQSCAEFLADFKSTSVVSVEKTVVKTVPEKIKPSVKPIQTEKEQALLPKKKNTGKKALIVALIISILVGLTYLGLTYYNAMLPNYEEDYDVTYEEDYDVTYEEDYDVTYEEDYDVTYEEDSDEGRTEYVYYEDGGWTEFVYDEDGGWTEYEYDEDGGLWAIYVYDEDGGLRAEYEYYEDGGWTKYVYDSNYNLIYEEDSDGNYYQYE